MRKPSSRLTRIKCLGWNSNKQNGAIFDTFPQQAAIWVDLNHHSLKANIRLERSSILSHRPSKKQLYSEFLYTYNRLNHSHNSLTSSEIHKFLIPFLSTNSDNATTLGWGCSQLRYVKVLKDGAYLEQKNVFKDNLKIRYSTRSDTAHAVS